MSTKYENNGCMKSSNITLALLIASISTASAIGYLIGRRETKLIQKMYKMMKTNPTNPTKNVYIESLGEDIRMNDKKSIVDIRINKIRALIPPSCLLEEIPLTTIIAKTVNKGRTGVNDILKGLDDRLVVVVGPCSIHDVDAANEYAKLLTVVMKKLEKDLHIIMRVYFEKPRTTIGWKGLINDPDLNGTFRINKGLRLARSLLCQINQMGLSVGCEFLDTISPQFTTDLVSWGAIGARTTECQLHRELASGLSMPIGFKNGTGGSLQLAVDAVVAARHSHCFLSVSSQGIAAIANTTGNDSCHVILRGGKQGPNYDKSYIDELSTLLKKNDLRDTVMIDCSHGNSRKNYLNQAVVAEYIGDLVANGDNRIMGIMLESNLKEGNQSFTPKEDLEYGKSITDSCLGWDQTVQVLERLAECVRKRREIYIHKY